MANSEGMRRVHAYKSVATLKGRIVRRPCIVMRPAPHRGDAPGIVMRYRLVIALRWVTGAASPSKRRAATICPSLQERLGERP